MGDGILDQLEKFHSQSGGAFMEKYVAEFVGTFVLVFSGCGAAVLAGDRIGYEGVALAFGLALLAMVYTIGHTSGCHINPAVTLGLLLTGKMDRKLAPGYWAAQIGGAILAAAVLLVVAKGSAAGYDPALQAWRQTATASTRPDITV